MGRKSAKSVKKQAPAEEPEKKRVRQLAEELNADELRALLAAKLNEQQPLSASGHEFVEVDPLMDVGVENPAADGDSPSESDDSTTEPDPDLKSKPADQSLESETDFPMPLLVKGDGERTAVKSPNAEEGQRDPVADVLEQVGEPEDPVENMKADEDMAQDGEPEDVADNAKADEDLQQKGGQQEQNAASNEVAVLKIDLEKQKKKTRKLKRENKQLARENLEKDQVILRLNQEIFKLKDDKSIPRPRFTTQPGMNVTVEDLEDFSGRADTNGKFISMLLVKLVGVPKLLTLSATGKPCQRFRKLRNADGTLKFPPKEKLDPEVFKFICDKVAERTAIKNGINNLELIRAESNKELVRLKIGWKINNLVKGSRSRQVDDQSQAGPSRPSPRQVEEPSDSSSDSD